MPIWSRKPPPAQRPKIEIRLERYVFTTLDTINGTVDVTSSIDVQVSDVEIMFVGTDKSFTQTPVSPVSYSGKRKALRVFLRLSQPSHLEIIPEDGILKAGTTYSFPFVFVIPERLTSHACEHEVDSEKIRQAHLYLPPTFGDCDLMRQLDLPDDLAPDNTAVRYGVYARVIQNETVEQETSSLVLATQARQVRIVPGSFADGLFDCSPETKRKMRRERMVHSGFMFAKKSGLVMETEPPPALFLPEPASESRNSISGTARIVLRFDPANDKCHPPKPDSVVTILQTFTFFSSTRRRTFPEADSAQADPSQFTHSHHRVLSRRSVNGVEWKSHDGTEPRPTFVSEDLPPEHQFFPEPSKVYQGGKFYTAEILVPVALPRDTTYVPSFHSCMLSRIYNLELLLNMHGGITGSDMDVTVPVQILSPRSRVRNPDNPHFSSVDYGTLGDDEEEADTLRRMFGSRQDSVVSFGHHGARLDSLPAYTR